MILEIASQRRQGLLLAVKQTDLRLLRRGLRSWEVNAVERESGFEFLDCRARGRWRRRHFYRHRSIGGGVESARVGADGAHGDRGKGGAGAERRRISATRQ